MEDLDSAGRVELGHVVSGDAGREPRVLIVRLLEACNAGCFMCGFSRSIDDYRFGLAETRLLLDEVVTTRIKVIRFTGGEPLLVGELPAMIAAIREAGIHTSLITNGWFLPERARDLTAAGLHQSMPIAIIIARDNDRCLHLYVKSEFISKR